MSYCNSRRLAIVPQGGNTGLVGGSVPVFDEVTVLLLRRGIRIVVLTKDKVSYALFKCYNDTLLLLACVFIMFESFFSWQAYAFDTRAVNTTFLRSTSI